MRWRIPAAAVLALFVALSCDQQPVEPAESDDALFAAQVFHYSGSFVNEFDLEIPCGDAPEDGHFVINGKWRCAERYDATGGYHLQCNLVTKGYGTGEFGSEWTIHETNPWVVYAPAGATEDKVYRERFNSMWVGKGHAPSWNDWWSWRWSMNANGDVIIDDFSHRTSCPEGS
jgi:hypothetical protein